VPEDRAVYVAGKAGSQPAMPGRLALSRCGDVTARRGNGLAVTT
jgi:hypothetical protein